MQRIKIVSTNFYRCILQQKRYLHYRPEDIVIAAAVRTPWGKYQGQLGLVGALQLGQMAAEAAVKQSSIPLEQVQQIFMNEKPQLVKNVEKEFIFSNFLKKSKYVPITVADKNEPKMDSLLKALDILKTQPDWAVVVGGLESATQIETLPYINHHLCNLHYDLFPKESSDVLEYYINKSVIKYLKSQIEGVFDAELISVAVQQQANKRRIMKEINRDEIYPEKCREDEWIFHYSDGASALVLTSYKKAQELKLSPLAVIKDFEYVKNTSNILACTRSSVENLLAKTGLNPNEIKHWEIEDSLPQIVVYLKHNLNLNFETVNPHGGSLITGHSTAASLTRLITHLTHNLKPNDYGCVVSHSSQEALALIIQKLPLKSPPNGLPLITLYTKDPCPLCDILIDELELYFPGEYELEKVFIDTKENLRFLRLYRLDVPVVFLNHQFLSMHRLNHRLLRRKLDLLKK